MNYDNTSYWQDIHQQFSGQLRAVGYSDLSEAFNVLKYQSETDTLLTILNAIRPHLENKTPLTMLEIGAGTGYWIRIVSEWFRRKGSTVEMSALDLSREALNIIRARYPAAKTIQADLKCIDPDLHAMKFDMVMSFYCLHHLTQPDGFLNALNFAARSVRPDGFFIIMDPVLSMPFSPFDAINLSTYQGNGIPRRLTFLDDALSKEGLKRKMFVPAVSFLLNGTIEDNARIDYGIKRSLWFLLKIVYRSDMLTTLLRPYLIQLDTHLKQKNRAFSSSICVYQKLS